jgi:L-2-hydroxyglutarate oxidase
MYRFCHEHGIAHERCGKIVVATSDAELAALSELERRGVANGLAGMRRLTADELREYEPNVTGIAGLHVPQTGITDYRTVTRAMAGVVRQRGGETRTDARVRGASVRDDAIVLDTSAGEIACGGLINCAGLQSDRVARMCGLEPEVRIVPFRGEYYTLSSNAAALVRNLIYPVPDPRFPFLGVHFTRMIGGGVEAGPNAVLSLARHGYGRFSFNFADALETARYGGTWRMARKHWKTGFGELHRSFSKRAFLRALRKLIPQLSMDDIVPGGSGVRAQALDRNGMLIDDFRIVRARRMVHVLNAPSPGATASIAIGQRIADLAAAALDIEPAHRSPAPLIPA